MGTKESKVSTEIPYSPSIVKTYPVLEIPTDNEGFCKSFDLNQEKEILEFFEEFGFVVINNIITKDGIDATINEVWDFLESEQHNPLSFDAPLVALRRLEFI
jgi:hypothetical protein